MNRVDSNKNNISINPYAGGISIPQHIVIPPSTLPSNSSNERKYHINSEITISYDPQKQKLTTEQPDDNNFIRESSGLTFSPITTFSRRNQVFYI